MVHGERRAADADRWVGPCQRAVAPLRRANTARTVTAVPWPEQARPSAVVGQGAARGGPSAGETPEIDAAARGVLEAPRVAGPMARVSLSLGIVGAMTCPGCLVTSSPDFSPPEQTRPEIVANDSFPPSPGLGKFALFQTTPANPDYTAVEFSAWVQSEDAGEDVQAFLLIDYGDDSGVSNGPYRSVVPGEPLPAATMADGPREVAIQWRPQQGETPGCHTVTLLVTHAFAQRQGIYYCPADPNDASMLTWFTLVCNQPLLEDCPQICPIEGQATSTSCLAAGAQP